MVEQQRGAELRRAERKRERYRERDAHVMNILKIHTQKANLKISSHAYF